MTVLEEGFELFIDIVKSHLSSRAETEGELQVIAPVLNHHIQRFSR